jgi:hypothetical protein
VPDIRAIHREQIERKQERASVVHICQRTSPGLHAPPTLGRCRRRANPGRSNQYQSSVLIADFPRAKKPHIAGSWGRGG